jgi:hypothetical protein
MLNPHARLARTRLWALAVAAILVVSGLGASPASAAPGAPGGLSPAYTAVNATPVLQWDRVAGATSYRVEVDDSADFASQLWNATTVNRRVVPSRQLPVGEIYWRVRAIDGTGSSDWASASFSRSGIAGPTLVSPANGTVLVQPTDPALLSWTPVAGADGYTVEVDDAADFIGTATYTTKTSSIVIPNPQIKTTYFWRVTASLGSGISSAKSDVRTYSIAGLAKPVLVGPSPSDPTTSVEDVVLEWQPVQGAKSYELQVSTDAGFNNFNGGVGPAEPVKGTRWSPPVTLNNDQFYWRVRPVDAQGNRPDWTAMDTWLFRRHWPDQPDLQYPVGDAVVGDPFFYQWTGVEHASHYSIEISPSSDFAPNPLNDTCSTVHTTFTPTKGDECWPGAAGSYYWRVTAHDDPGNVVSQQIYAEIGHFTYSPEVVSLSAPNNGATVQVPTLSWQPVAGAAQYRVTITDTSNGSVAATATTAALSFTPRGLLTVGNTYRWQVQTVSDSNRLGAGYFPEDQPQFTVAAMPAASASDPDPVTPAAASHSVRFPSLTWTPVSGATNYKVWVRRAGTIGFYQVSGTFAYPAGVDESDDWLSADSYEWKVEAYNGGTFLSSSTVYGSFVIDALPTVSGHRAAMYGTALASNTTSCDAALPSECLDMRQTPVLRWDPIPNAGCYKLYLSRDAEMTNPVYSNRWPILVESNMWADYAALFEGQAGSAFFWKVLPCKLKTAGASNSGAATHSFNKLSNPIEVLSPANGATVQDDVTFTWRDFLATNLSPGGVDGTGVNSHLEAKQYHIQVASDPGFTALVDEATVDQTTYTATNKTYPEGPLYWRVQAIDGSGNQLAWSRLAVQGTNLVPYTITKSSPLPSLTSPTNGTTVGATAPFRWAPLDYAGSYDIEVYKDGDTTGSAVNKVISGNSKQVAYTTGTPLPASPNPYLWRMRRLDADGKPGAWTSLSAPNAAFRVSGAAPVQLSPLGGATVAADDNLFTWDAVDGATTYRFERRAAGSTSMAETVTTPALAWAPTGKLTGGNAEWRVTSIDAAGKVMGTSAWRSYAVPSTTTTTPPPTTTTPPPTTTPTGDTTRPKVSSASPTGKVKRDVSFKAKFSEVVKGASVSTKTMKIKKKGSSKSLPAVVSLSSDKRTAKLNPKQNLKSGKTYIIKLTTGVKDKAGNALVAYKWTVKVK